jgi:hypothetical protein
MFCLIYRVFPDLAVSKKFLLEDRRENKNVSEQLVFQIVIMDVLSKLGGRAFLSQHPVQDFVRLAPRVPLTVHNIDLGLKGLRL